MDDKNTAAPFNLANLDEVVKNADEGAVCQIRHPVTGEDIPGFWIKVCGKDSKRYKEATRKINNRRLRSRMRTLESNQLERESCEMLADCTLGWGEFKMGSDAVLPFTRENAIQLYLEYRIVRDQIDAFIDDHANFTKA